MKGGEDERQRRAGGDEDTKRGESKRRRGEEEKRGRAFWRGAQRQRPEGRGFSRENRTRVSRMTSRMRTVERAHAMPRSALPVCPIRFMAVPQLAQGGAKCTAHTLLDLKSAQTGSTTRESVRSYTSPSSNSSAGNQCRPRSPAAAVSLAQPPKSSRRARGSRPRPPASRWHRRCARRTRRGKAGELVGCWQVVVVDGVVHEE